MDTNDTIHSLRQASEEILQEDELANLLNAGGPVNHYIGFEISGKVHLGTGIQTMRVIKALQEAGVHTTCFLADWHSYINKKLGGDIKTIRKMAHSYFKEALIASALCVGADPSKINFVLADDVYTSDFWLTTLDVASHITLARGKRSIDIAGREAGDDIPVSILFYPPMQIADIFNMGIHIAHAGTDQRKAHVVARQIALKLNHKKLLNQHGEPMKPIALHHHLLQGLSQPPVWPIPEDKKREMVVSMKMSKSNPGSAVFIHDSEDEIRSKIQKAFCPPVETEYNPILDWTEHVIFPLRKTFSLKRPQEFGGDMTFENIKQVKEAYASGTLHPGDLKKNVADYLIDILTPARAHFDDPARREALEEMNKIHITR